MLSCRCWANPQRSACLSTTKRHNWQGLAQFVSEEFSACGTLPKFGVGHGIVIEEWGLWFIDTPSTLYSRGWQLDNWSRNKGNTMQGSGGTDGGVRQFLIGFGLAAVGVYLFFDSVRVVTDGAGMISGALRRRGQGGGGMGGTTSMGILFVPFFLGVFSLFVNSRQKWAWGLTYIGMAILTVEILSRIQFYINTRLTHLMLMLVLFAAGCALMFRSYGDVAAADDTESETKP